MKMSLNLNPRKIAIFMGMIAVLLALQSIYGEYVLANILGLQSNTAPARLLDIFSVNREESLPTWFSSINLFLAAVLLGWITLSKRLRQEKGSGYWLGLSLIFLYLSMDEGSAIHETTSGPLQDAFGSSGFFEFGWLILGIPLVLIFGLVYFRFWLRLPWPTKPLFAIAAALYVGGAILIEGISANQYSMDGGSSFLYLAIATVEELCEMLGVIVFIYALLDYLQRSDHSLTLQTQTQDPGFSAARMNWPYSLRRTAVVFALILIGVNGGLLSWGIALRDAPPANAAAPYHFYILVDELAQEGVNLTHISGLFTPSEPQFLRALQPLVADFASVQLLSLPALNASILITSDRPVLDNELVVELMTWIDETEYVFLDDAIIRAVLGASG